MRKYSRLVIYLLIRATSLKSLLTVMKMVIPFISNTLVSCPDSTLRARTNNEPTQDIVVKSVERYGETAHQLLAAEGLAPNVFFFGSPHLDDERPSYRSISMVMEFFDGETLDKAKPSLNKETCELVQFEVEKALNLLHGKGLVFGDLRLPNIMITKAKQVKFIDFDWAGVEGETLF